MGKRKVALQFPGQGVQYPQMGKDIYDASSLVRELFEEAEDLLKMPLRKICFEGDADVLKKTVNSQILIFVTSYALFCLFKESFPTCTFCVAAGLSLGEYTALCALGYSSYSSVLQAVQKRSILMEQACQKNEGTMAALMGWTSDRVERFVEELRMPHDVWIANYNCFGQIVLSGTKRGMEAALQKAKEQGIKRALLLNVQGAFHSGLMRSAEEAFAPVIEEMPLLMQKVPIVMNVSAKAASSEAEVRKNLISQVMGSVRWEQSLKTMQGFDPDCFIEVGPGKTLTGFAKRTLEQVTLFSIEKLEDFDTLSQSL